MPIKKIILLLAMALCLMIAGCINKDAEINRDEEINAFLTEWDSVTRELVQKIKAGDLDGAKTFFDAKKTSLKRNWDSANKAKKFQVSEATRKRMKESRTKNSAALQGTMEGILMMKTPPDKAKFDKHKAIIDEYDEIFRYPLETL